ncbi:MAG: chemoreceptor glutamine deamidase CheD [Alphaproteobacteria bacterium]|nr:chemoreceptor glutamine deamidase CheD [Alphaproteobacteria bacterium]
MLQVSPRSERRVTPDAFSVKEHFHGGKRFFDAAEQVEVVKILSGDCHVSSKPDEVLVTILGSCVSACIRDPLCGIGGMNHFLLPGSEATSAACESTRYGVFAMETLINGILKAGGCKNRLEVKVFGGGNVINHSARIGSQNAHFIREFLLREGFRIASEDLEGDFPRRIHYYPATGRVMVRRLLRQEDMRVAAQEALYLQKITRAPLEGKIELF